MQESSSRAGARDAPSGKPSVDEEIDLVARLRAGDETAFTTLIGRYQAALVRLAMAYVGNRSAAEDVTQETWLAVFRGIDRFAGRSSLKTWLFHILANRARTRAARDARIVPFSELGEPAVDPERFFSANHPRWPHGWSSPPASWEGIPEERFIARDTRARIEAAIDALPTSQRLVITLRDIEGLSADEVCQALDIGEANQRVLLHRARSRVRRALELYFTDR